MTYVRRPSPDELLAGVMQTLSEKVAPQVADPYARSQLATAASLLDYVRVRFDTAVKNTLAEIASLEGALAGWVEPLRSAGEAELAARVKSLVGARETDFAWSVLAARSDALQEGLFEVGLLAERAMDDAGPLAALSPAVRAELRALNARRL